MLNTNNLTRTQKNGLKELGKILNTKFEDKEPTSIEEVLNSCEVINDD